MREQVMARRLEARVVTSGAGAMTAGTEMIATS